MTPSWGVKIPHVLQPKKKKKQTRKHNIKHEQFCNKFNKDFKNSPQQKILKKKVMQEPSFDKISETCYFFFFFR